jgi:hypothetical protein
VKEDPLALTAQSPAQDTRDGSVTLEFSFIGDYCSMGFCDATPFGCISQRISRVLKRLVALPDVHIKGIATWPSLEKARAQWKQSGKAAISLIDISVNEPGLDHVAKFVGKGLSDANLFLQLPRFATSSFHTKTRGTSSYRMSRISSLRIRLS